MEILPNKLTYVVQVLVFSYTVSSIHSRKPNIQARRICLFDYNCPENEMCYWLRCIPKLKNGESCAEDKKCVSGICSGVCIQLRYGQECSKDVQCLSGECAGTCRLSGGFDVPYPRIKNKPGIFTMIVEECEGPDGICHLPWRTVVIEGTTLHSIEERKSLGRLITRWISTRPSGKQMRIILHNTAVVGAVMGDVISHVRGVEVTQISIFPDYMRIGVSYHKNKVWMVGNFYLLPKLPATVSQFADRFAYFGKIATLKLCWLTQYKLEDPTFLHGLYLWNIESVELWMTRASVIFSSLLKDGFKVTWKTLWLVHGAEVVPNNADFNTVDGLRRENLISDTFSVKYGLRPTLSIPWLPRKQEHDWSVLIQSL